MNANYVIFGILVTFVKRRCVLASVQIPTSKGLVLGYTLDLGANHSNFYYGRALVFQGIPFAKPPIGNLRLQEPQEMDSWTNPIEANKYQSACIQPHILDFIPGFQTPTNYSEDCLYLNVFTSAIGAEPPLPVMVWIHGGGFVSGSAANYDARGIVTQFVNRGVVVVTIQYRLGLLGFFTTKTPAFPPNLGLLDAVMALQWVKKEISRFGGDPNRITIFGESSGGCAVSSLTYSPIAKGLFQRAIMQSGTTETCLDGRAYFHERSFESAQKLCGFTVQQWEMPGNEDLLRKCLHEKTTAEIVEKQAGPFWYAVADPSSKVLPDWPTNLAKNRSNIPVIVGTNRDEMADLPILSIYYNQTTLADNNEGSYRTKLTEVVSVQKYGGHTAVVQSVVDALYRTSQLPAIQPQQHQRWMKAAVDLESDYLFSSPTMNEVDWWIKETRNPNVYLYSFEYEGDMFTPLYFRDYKAVYHTTEIMYLFKMVAQMFNHSVSNKDIQMMANIATMWTNFAKNGRPTNAKDAFDWQPVTVARPDRHLRISDTNAIGMADGFHAAAIKLWNTDIPALTGGSATPTEPPLTTPSTPDATTTTVTSTMTSSSTTTSHAVTTPTKTPDRTTPTAVPTTTTSASRPKTTSTTGGGGGTTTGSSGTTSSQTATPSTTAPPTTATPSDRCCTASGLSSAAVLVAALYALIALL